ncbi:PTS sugar transporter [Lactobacillus johnsonii]|uniref:PTS sugar transporter subunit IIA domain-containing protein n=1 Tax=Lactobacillus johnsonii TaxID=33959 RepID=UPI003D77584B
MLDIETIVTGHGNFATGFKSAVELLAGVQPSIKYIDFTEGMSDVDLGKKIKSSINEKPTLIFCDLVGGTPYKEAAKIAFNENNVQVVAGCNLASLLETIFNRYDSLSDYANELVKISKMSIQTLDLSDLSNGEKSEDGI